MVQQSEELVLRDMEPTDFDKGYMALLAQLTEAGDVKKEDFVALVEYRRKDPGYKTLVIEDTGKGVIAATATLLIERKFIHGLALMGHVEDVVVDEAYRGRGLGVRIVQALSAHAKEIGCYRVILDCRDDKLPFYEKCGFKYKDNCCVQYFS